MASWPATLDYQPLNESYAHSFADPRRRQAVEQGTGRQRRIYSKAQVRLDMAWMFSPAEFWTFRQFLDDGVNDGATKFTMPVLTGSIYETLTVGFIKGTIKPARAESEWKVSATLETDPLPVMSSGALDALIGAAPAPGPNLPAWPNAWLANPLERTFGLTLPDPVIRSDFDDGLSLQSRQFKAAPAYAAVTWPMVNARYDAFRAWLVYRVYGGEGWFSVPVFRGDQYVTQAARIKQSTLKATREGEDWLVHATLELRDLPAIADTIGIEWSDGNPLDWDNAGGQLMAKQ